MKVVKSSRLTLAGATSFPLSITSALLTKCASHVGSELNISSGSLSFRRCLFLRNVRFILVSRRRAASFSSALMDVKSRVLAFAILSRDHVHPGRNRGGLGGHMASHWSIVAVPSLLELSSIASSVLVSFKATMICGRVRLYSALALILQRSFVASTMGLSGSQQSLTRPGWRLSGGGLTVWWAVVCGWMVGLLHDGARGQLDYVHGVYGTCAPSVVRSGSCVFVPIDGPGFHVGNSGRPKSGGVR